MKPFAHKQRQLLADFHNGREDEVELSLRPDEVAESGSAIRKRLTRHIGESRYVAYLAVITNTVDIEKEHGRILTDEQVTAIRDEVIVKLCHYLDQHPESKFEDHFVFICGATVEAIDALVGPAPEPALEELKHVG